jgi:DNA polymerase-1
VADASPDMRPLRRGKDGSVIAIDFETQAIAGNPTVRPPQPVGMAYKRSGYKGRYLAWGHPTGNSPGAFEKAQAILRKAIAEREPIVMHNSKFDIAVAEAHMGVRFDPDPTLIHDTLFSVFLHDPYADTFSLKPSSERILGLPPSEQDSLRDWILTHVAGATEKNFGAFIAKAPVQIVTPYAIGDVDRTLRLHQFLIGQVPQAAYTREQKLRNILMGSERRGILCDVERLAHDTSELEAALIQSTQHLQTILQEEEIDTPTKLANALDRAGKIGKWVLTPTGKRSTSRPNLEAAIADKEVLHLLQYRGALSHLLSQFARPWLELADQYGGRLHPEWNQVRQSYHNDESLKLKGTKTGRLSCSKPNFQNMPNEYTITIPKGYPALPLMRQYILADKGYRWLKRDYSQQELRIMAHYSEGRLCQRYKLDPRIDAHVETSNLIVEHTGLTLPRKHVKITGFSVIYGAGKRQLASQLGVTEDEAASILRAYFKALPEVPKLMQKCSQRGNSGGTIITWGGREYPVEPPKILKNGRYANYSYKLLNYLIQGSAGDCTKESLIRWDQDKGDAEFLATVHDENDIQAPEDSWRSAMRKLKKAMESIEFDVKMVSDGFTGVNWANLKECQ